MMGSNYSQNMNSHISSQQPNTSPLKDKSNSPQKENRNVGVTESVALLKGIYIPKQYLMHLSSKCFTWTTKPASPSYSGPKRRKRN